jgi:hypothetical protein
MFTVKIKASPGLAETDHSRRQELVVMLRRWRDVGG